MAADGGDERGRSEPEPSTEDGPLGAAVSRRGLIALAAGGLAVGAGAWAFRPAPVEVTGDWRELPLLPRGRGEMKIASLDDRIYVPGGMTRLGGSTARLDIYDAAAGTWTQGTSMPVALNHHATTSLDGFIYVVGGNESFTDPPGTFAFAYGPEADAWRELPALPDGRWGHEMLAYDGRLYVLGGVPHGDTAIDTLVYAPDEERWERAAPIPTLREHVAAAPLDGELVVVGGRWEGELTDAVEAYDPAADAWRELPSLPTTRSGFGAASIDGRLHAVGGEDPATFGGWTSAVHEVYDAGAATWETETPAPLPLHGHGVAQLADTLHVVGGAWRQGVWSATAWNDRTFAYEP